MNQQKPSLTIYKASAGSGKTYTLALEYIARLASTDNPNEYQKILAVTFTNKATAEMKERILQYLYGIANQLPSCNDFQDSLIKLLKEKGIKVSKKMLQLRTRNALKAILHDYTHFQVETIDSFFQSILRNLAHELGLNANLQIELNVKELVNRSVDRLIENLRDQNDEVKEWIKDYIESQMHEGQAWDVTNIIKNFALCIYDEAFQNRSTEERKILDDAGAIRQFRSKMFAIIESERASIVKEGDALEKKVDCMELNFARISNGEKWYRTTIIKMKNLELDEPSATFLKVINGEYECLLKGKDKKDNAIILEAQTISALFKNFFTHYENARKEVSTARLAVKYINELRLLGCIEQRSKEILAENNQFYLSNTPTLLSQLIKDCDSPFIFEKIGTKLNHIMIDEFQDTSEMQWSNFKVLLLENQSVGGQDLVVGDVKQSIYRWRNGNWEILDGLEYEMNKLDVKNKPLDTNYRSQFRIIDFNNKFFPYVAQHLDKKAEESKINDIYKGVKQKCNKKGQNGYVNIRIYDKNHPEVQSQEEYITRQARDIIAHIRQLTAQGVTLDQMAIIVRYNKTGKQLVNAFLSEAPDINLTSDEAYLLESSISIQMLIATLRFLVSDIHRNPIPFYFLVKHYTENILKQKMKADYYTDAEICKKLLPEKIVCQSSALVKMPLYELCEELYKILSLNKISGQEAFMLAFFDEVQNHIRHNPADILSFLNAWDEKIHANAIPATKTTGIQILSIHKSKGLEYHTIFLPSNDWAIEEDHRGDTNWCIAEDDKYNELGHLPIPLSKEMSKTCYSQIYAQEHLQKRIDTINLLYVAFTRAGSNLFIYGKTSKTPQNNEPLKTTTTGDLIYDFIASQNDGCFAKADNNLLYTYEYGTIFNKDNVNEDKTKVDVNRLKLQSEPFNIQLHSYEPNLNFMQSNQSEKFISSLTSENDTDTGRQSYLDIGKIMHYVLSQVRNQNDIPYVLNKCQASGIITDERMKETIIERLKYGFNNPIIKSWFATDIQTYNECSIITHTEDGDTIIRRPDRVVMTNNKIIVVDYKFGKNRPEYQHQVMEYMQALKQMHPANEVYGYLWFIYSGKIEEVKA